VEYSSIRRRRLKYSLDAVPAKVPIIPKSGPLMTMSVFI